jgi:outer membrane protein TolC
VPPENPFSTALKSRPDLAALKSRLGQFDAKARLADAERIPDPTFSLMSGREAGEQLVKVGISFPIPLLNSHNGAYRASLAEASRTRNKLEWLENRLQLEVQAALYNHTSAMQALSHAYQIEESSASSDNIKLAQTAFNAGELNLEELVIHINQALDARLTALNIMKQGWLARIRLAEVLGHPEYILEGIQQ